MSGLDAIVLAGGRSRRLGGVDKALLEVVDGGVARTLVARACAQVSDAGTTVVVGPVDNGELPADVLVVREKPAFGGPAAALGAGLEALGVQAADWVVVLACDLPDVGPAVDELRRAVTAGPAVDAVVTVDDAGRRQWLVAAYRVSALRAAVAAAAPLDGKALRDVVAPLERIEVVVTGPALLDIDTWDAVRRRGSIRPRTGREGVGNG